MWVSVNRLKYTFKELVISNHVSHFLHCVKIRAETFGMYLQNILKPDF